jgi:hypothetical protein
MDEGTGLRRTMSQGLRRAGLHWLRAGYEMVAGVGALLDELVRVRRDPPAGEAGASKEGGGLTRIDLE